jgi:hypothetical protein
MTGGASVVISPDPAVNAHALSVIAGSDQASCSGLGERLRGEPVHRLDIGDGLVTIAARADQIPADLLRTIMAFRLAQYLRLGWVCPRLVHARHLDCEDGHDSVVADVHVVCHDAGTGRILGYVGLAGSVDARPLALDDPNRHRLPTEQAHRIDLLGPYAGPSRTTHDVFEVKRFLRHQDLPDCTMASLVPWHVVLGFGRALLAAGGPERRVLVAGDAKEHGAMRHLVVMGLDVDVVHGTSPRLPPDDLLWPIYTQPVVAKPFVGRLPDTYAGGMDLIEDYLGQVRGQAGPHRLVAQLVRRNAKRTRA